MVNVKENLDLIKNEYLKEYRDKNSNTIDERLDVFREYGSFSPVTDFAKIIGANYKTIIGSTIPTLFKDEISVGEIFVNDTKSRIKDETDLGDGSLVWNSNYDGGKIIFGCYGMPGIRPMIMEPQIFKTGNLEIKEDSFVRNIYSPVEVNNFKKMNVNYKYIEYGEYPAWTINNELSSTLEALYLKGELPESGKFYNIPMFTDRYDKANYYIIKEYLYNDKRYVRVKAVHDVYLSNKQKYNKGDYIWIQVSPIKWLYDEKTKILISNYILSVSNNLANAQNYLETYLANELFYNKDLDKFYTVYSLAKIKTILAKNDFNSDDVIAIIKKEFEKITDSERYMQILNKIKILLNQTKNIKDVAKRTEIINLLENTTERLIKSLENLKKIKNSKFIPERLTLEPEKVLFVNIENLLDEIAEKIVRAIKMDEMNKVYFDIINDTKKYK